MKKTIGFRDFKQEFKDYNFIVLRDNFSEEGLKALFEHLEQLENDLDAQIELDVIALCCDYTESNIINALEDNKCENFFELCRNTQVIDIFGTDRIIYGNC